MRQPAPGPSARVEPALICAGGTAGPELRALPRQPVVPDGLPRALLHAVAEDPRPQPLRLQTLVSGVVSGVAAPPDDQQVAVLHEALLREPRREPDALDVVAPGLGVVVILMIPLFAVAAEAQSYVFIVGSCGAAELLCMVISRRTAPGPMWSQFLACALNV